MKIKINKNTAWLPLSQKEYDRLIENKNTINLSNRLTTKQILRKRDIRKAKRDVLPILKLVLWAVIIFSIIILGNLFKTPVNANYEVIPDEYKYYWVDNFQDYARAIRKETCYRVWKKVLWDNLTVKQVKHCATTNTLITAIESNYMKSNRCIKDNNCKWLKGWSNGKYWFMKFKNLYEQNLYFAEKWFKYHYKKSLYTLVYWYRQKDGSLKYGWTYTQQDTYYNFLRSKYNRVYKSL